MKRSVIVTLAALTMVLELSLPVTAASRAPLGFQLMCLQHPLECRGGGDSSILLTEQLLESIQRVNADVNRSITPRSDGAADTWSLAGSAGDCEDYVIQKRRALIGAGLPSSALRFAHVVTRGGADHAVLIVKTSGGDLVLDNMVAEVRPVQAMEYRIVATSGADPLHWN